jgi:hypothetical protein
MEPRLEPATRTRQHLGMLRLSRVSCAVVVVVLFVSSAGIGTAGAAGVTTHAWMALDAIDLITDASLHDLLDANRSYVEAGAQFPDSGYWNNTIGGVPGGDYGEEAHWQRFYDGYADQIRNDPSCGDLTDPDGPCAPRIAHLMGALGHGYGDEVWDWLFEPNAPDFGESYVPPDLTAIFGAGGIEFQMDMVAIGVHGRPTSPDTPPWPDEAKLAAVFAALGRPDISVSGLESGKSGMTIIRNGEGALTPTYLQDILDHMPNTAAMMVTAPGGVNFAAQAIARAQENLWGRILGDQPATEVANTYPAAGESDVPTTGWDRASFQTGSSPDRGGARNRITAVLSYALPYRTLATDTAPIPSQLPDGAMTLTEVDSGASVPIKSGYPRAVPYGADAGEHTIDIQPADNLQSCTEYRVDVTDRLIDANGQPVTPMSWTFTTDGCTEPPPDTTPPDTTPPDTNPTTITPAPDPEAVPVVAVVPVAAVSPRYTG